MTDDVREETGDIPPALDARGWASLANDPRIEQLRPSLGDGSAIASAIAILNSGYNDEDPRKFTWETVNALRELAKFQASDGLDLDPAIRAALDLADVIAAYLPPRT